MAAKKKPTISPEAAKILEQYRNANKSLPTGPDGAPGVADNNGVPKPNTPPPASQQRRSGTRGK